MNSKSYETLRKLSRGRFSTTNFAKLKLLAKTLLGIPMTSYCKKWTWFWSFTVSLIQRLTKQKV